MTSTVIVNSERYDETLRLVGDEETGVGLDCRLCDRGGAPVAYYPPHPGDCAYEGTDVQAVQSITALIEAGQQHLGERHAG